MVCSRVEVEWLICAEAAEVTGRVSSDVGRVFERCVLVSVDDIAALAGFCCRAVRFVLLDDSE